MHLITSLLLQGCCIQAYILCTMEKTSIFLPISMEIKLPFGLALLLLVAVLAAGFAELTLRKLGVHILFTALSHFLCF